MASSKPYFDNLLCGSILDFNMFLFPFQLREQLMRLIRDTGKVIHEPYVTTKHGRLRSKRKSKREPIPAIDDLATLEDLTEVCVGRFYFSVFNQSTLAPLWDFKKRFWLIME